VSGVRSTAARIEVDEPIILRRGGLWLDLGQTELRPAGNATAWPVFLLRIEGAAGVTVRGGSFGGGRWAVLVEASRDATLHGSRFEGQRGGGIVITHAPGAVVADATLTGLHGAPVLVHGNTVGAALLGNEIVHARGTSNWHAGIVITDRSGDLSQDPEGILAPDRHGIREQRIDERLEVPRRNVIAFNRVALNASSGIYSDGGIQNVIFDNVVEGNAKEGLCLDNGSTANVVAMNVVRQNGKRWGQSDEALRLDFVQARGRLPDGSSPAKTPGLSIDNAAYNIVYANQFDRNHGGGVKMVRTAFFNQVGLNVVTDNNEGASRIFHFFGIELGAARADVPTTDLDFTGSRGNIVFGNIVRGSHYAGIFYAEGSTDNEVFDNSIFGATNWAQEQVRRQPNATLNNLSNLPSRNIDSGLDPKLLELSRGRFD
jgi:parallel beta-helix repeat protein